MLMPPGLSTVQVNGHTVVFLSTWYGEMVVWWVILSSGQVLAHMVYTVLFKWEVLELFSTLTLISIRATQQKYPTYYMILAPTRILMASKKRAVFSALPAKPLLSFMPYISQMPLKAIASCLHELGWRFYDAVTCVLSDFMDNIPKHDWPVELTPCIADWQTVYKHWPNSGCHPSKCT